MFEKDMHSNPTVAWKPATTDQREAVHAVARAWGMGNPISVQQVVGSEVWSQNFRIECSNRKYLLRKNILASLPQIEASILAMTFLHEEGVLVPHVVSAADGQQIVECEGNHWTLFDFVDGNYFRGDKEELRQAARVIAEMHIVLARFPAVNRILPVEEVLGPLRLDAVRLRRSGNEYEELIWSTRLYLDSLVQKARDDLALVTPSREQVTHLDLHCFNLLSSAGTIKAIIDFGNIAFGPIENDIATACHRLVRQCLVYNDLSWKNSLRPILEIFLNEYGSVNAISDGTFLNLGPFMKALLLRKMCTNVTQYSEGKRNADFALSIHLRYINLLEEAEAIERVLVSL